MLVASLSNLSGTAHAIAFPQHVDTTAASHKSQNCQHALADVCTKYTAKHKFKNYQRTQLMSAQNMSSSSVSNQGTVLACTYHLATLPNQKYLTRAFFPKKTVQKTTTTNCIRRAISESQTHQHLHSSNSMTWRI